MPATWTHIASDVAKFPKNLMWETDYPHPTSQYPSPNSSAVRPGDYADEALAGIDESVVRAILQDTPARLYNVEI